MRKTLLATAAAIGTLAFAASAQAGPVFLTGHDPDFHSQDSAGAANLLTTMLDFVTGGTYAGGTEKFLFVEANIAAPGGHRVGANGLVSIGLTAGVNFDKVDAAGLAALASFSGYSAIVVASDFGGLLTDAEIRGLVARAGDIKNFVNAGGGLAAFAECGIGYVNCQPDLVNATTPLFGFVPVGVSAVNTFSPYSVTAYGASLGLTNADVNDPTHNSFGVTGGLNIVDTDAGGQPTSLAGNVRIGDGGFIPTPEPATFALFGAGLAGIGALRRRKAAKGA